MEAAFQTKTQKTKKIKKNLKKKSVGGCIISELSIML